MASTEGLSNLSYLELGNLYLIKVLNLQEAIQRFTLYNFKGGGKDGEYYF